MGEMFKGRQQTPRKEKGIKERLLVLREILVVDFLGSTEKGDGLPESRTLFHEHFFQHKHEC